MLMVKPGLAYLDLVRQVKDKVNAACDGLVFHSTIVFLHHKVCPNSCFSNGETPIRGTVTVINYIQWADKQLCEIGRQSLTRVVSQMGCNCTFKVWSRMRGGLLQG